MPTTLYWKDVVSLARRTREWDERELRAQLSSLGISSGTVTNWKGTRAGPGRPIPPRNFKLIADLLGVSVDDLHRKHATPADASRRPYYTLYTDEFLRLSDEAKTHVREHIELIKGAVKRARKSGDLDPAYKS